MTIDFEKLHGSRVNNLPFLLQIIVLSSEYKKYIKKKRKKSNVTCISPCLLCIYVINTLIFSIYLFFLCPESFNYNNLYHLTIEYMTKSI